MKQLFCRVFLTLALWPICTVISAGGLVTPEERIIEQLQVGESIFRDDIINDALARLYRVNPNHPEGIAAEIRMAVRHEQMDEAQQLLERLRKIAPDSAAYRLSSVLLRVSSPEGKESLAEARLYSAVGRVADARERYDALFEGSFPTTDLALEYWQLRAREEGGRPQALRELLTLVDQRPEHPELLAMVAEYLFAEGRPEEARQFLRQLAKHPAYRTRAANREFEYLDSRPVNEQSAHDLSEFAADYADINAGRLAAERYTNDRTLLEDPAWRAGQEGLVLLAQGRSEDALKQLLQGVARYPHDVEYQGALGLAYLRTGDRRKALSAFEAARDNTTAIDDSSRWVSLIGSTRYWLLLEEASVAAEQADWASAKRLYGQAHRLDPDNVFALVGLADAKMALSETEAAWGLYHKALTQSAGDPVAIRGVARFVSSLSPERGLQVLDKLSAGQQRLFVELRRNLTVSMLQDQAQVAQAEKRWADASELLSEAQQLAPDDTWLSYQLAQSLRGQGKEAEAMSAYQRHLEKNMGVAESHYAHALLLSAVDSWQSAMISMKSVSEDEWIEAMHALNDDLQDRERINVAVQLYQQGQTRAAIESLERWPLTTRLRLQIAAWAFETADYRAAIEHYIEVLQKDPGNLDARLGQVEVWAAQGRQDKVRSAIESDTLTVPSGDVSANRRLAELWVGVGDKAKAKTVLEQLRLVQSEPDPLVLRDLAVLTKKDSPQAALDLYAEAFIAAGLLSEPVSEAPRDDAAFTFAMREELEDGWLERSLRSQAETLYKQQAPKLTVHNDTAWRTDGTPGYSRLTANTTMAHLEYPLGEGKVFLRADQVVMDAGRFNTGADGTYRGNFGTCSFSARAVGGSFETLPGCSSGLKQTARGTSVAVGWSDERLSVDIGTTPQGFSVSNIVGGLTYRSRLGSTGISLTASRRPMSNSLLSFAGTKDPRTGITWGGVIATGVSAGLSWDQGGTDGVWADVSHHRLTGKNVSDNERTRLMGGYYRRLINRPDERLTAGLNLMHWQYAKDLSGYTLGQGGYYSPQRYSSASFPVEYARRTPNWSFVLQGAVSFSKAKTSSSSYYPLPHLIDEPSNQLNQLGVTNASIHADNRFAGSSSSGVGYSIRGAAERRLGDRWIAGVGVDWRRSKDYSPSRFLVYLRYSFQPWKGSLDLAPSALEPYADFK